MISTSSILAPVDGMNSSMKVFMRIQASGHGTNRLFRIVRAFSQKLNLIFSGTGPPKSG